MMKDFGNPNYWPVEFIENVPRLQPPFSPEVRKILRESNLRLRAKVFRILDWRTLDINELALLIKKAVPRITHNNIAKSLGISNPGDFSSSALDAVWRADGRGKGLMFCEEPGEPLLSMHECRMAFEELQRRQGKNQNNDEGGYHIEIILPLPLP